MTRRLSHAILLASILIVAAAPSFSQSLPASVFALSHPFTLPTATTTRLFGMGGFISCIPDAGFANPAFAGALTHASSVARTSTTSFDSGLQFTGFNLSTVERGPTSAMTSLAITENELAVHYGQRVSRHLLLGLGLSPDFHNTDAVDVNGGGPAVARVTSRAKSGFHAGGLYQLGDKGWLGAIYDVYNEDVTANQFLPPPPAETAGRFTSKEMAGGLSYKLSNRVLGAIEWQELTTKTGGVKIGGGQGWRAGLETAVDEHMSFRVGDNQGSLSLGLGVHDKRWNANYAFIKDWNKHLVESFLGEGSDTHQLEFSYDF